MIRTRLPGMVAHDAAPGAHENVSIFSGMFKTRRCSRNRGIWGSKNTLLCYSIDLPLMGLLQLLLRETLQLQLHERTWLLLHELMLMWHKLLLLWHHLVLLWQNLLLM